LRSALPDQVSAAEKLGLVFFNQGECCASVAPVSAVPSGYVKIAIENGKL
jgi:hypothetical protein